MSFKVISILEKEVLHAYKLESNQLVAPRFM